jgi:hypothetical protein
MLGRPIIGDDRVHAADRYAFFGKRFDVSFDEPSFRRLFFASYRGLQDEDDGAPTSASFALRSMNRDAPELLVTAHHHRLVDAFTRGTNRRRFTVREISHNGTMVFEVSDAFLGSSPVMVVRENCATLLDLDRCYAATESVIFHTVLSLIPNYHVMHAGVVAWGEKALLLCGETNRGKTTLTLGLVRAGWKFLSDEIAFIDLARCSVAPFPRAIGMRENSIRMFPEVKQEALTETKSLGGEAKWLVDVERVFRGSVGQESPITAIVLLDGFSDSPILTPVSASEAMFACMKVTHSAEDDPMKVMLNVADVVNRAHCFRLKAGAVTDTAAAITAMMTRR